MAGNRSARFVFYLNLSDSDESRIHDVLQEQPSRRRSDWIREMLKAGMEAAGGEAARVQPATARQNGGNKGQAAQRGGQRQVEEEATDVTPVAEGDPAQTALPADGARAESGPDSIAGRQVSGNESVKAAGLGQEGDGLVQDDGREQVSVVGSSPLDTERKKQMVEQLFGGSNKG